MRAKVSEVVLAASQCRTTISEAVQTSPTTDMGTTLTDSCEGTPTKYVKGITVSEDGVITGEADPANLAQLGTNVNLELRPLVDGVALNAGADGGKNVTEWACGPAATNGIDKKYLPGSCRQ